MEAMGHGRDIASGGRRPVAGEQKGGAPGLLVRNNRLGIPGAAEQDAHRARDGDRIIKGRDE
jgi:hypothetical protein